MYKGKALGESTQLTLAVQRGAEVGMPSDFKEALSAFSDQESFFVRRLNDSQVAGYTLLKAVYGHPSAMIRAELPSTIYRRGLVPYTLLRAHETLRYLLCRLLLEQNKFYVAFPTLSFRSITNCHSSQHLHYSTPILSLSSTLSPLYSPPPPLDSPTLRIPFTPVH